MAAITKSTEATEAKHREFRRFLSRSGEKNLLRAFLEWQKHADPQRSYRWWAARWNVDYSLVCMWAQPFEKAFRRVGPNNRHVFEDLGALAGVTMDEYYRSTPSSTQKDAPAVSGMADRARQLARAASPRRRVVVVRKKSSGGKGRGAEAVDRKTTHK